MNQKTERRKAYELIDLEQIYPGMQDEIRWAVVTNLEEPILLREYPELESKRPFLLLLIYKCRVSVPNSQLGT